MKKQYIQLLQKQIEKLSSEEFDLEAWKSGAVSVLSRIFGKEDTRAEQIEQLKIDYSSWALRDSNANYKPVETAKLKGKEILHSAIDEIEVFGVDEEKTSDKLGSALAEEIKGMTDSQRKKHFEGLKKGKLVELLLSITSE